MRSVVLLLVGLLVPAVAGAQAPHEEAPHAAPVRSAGPKGTPVAPHEESRAEPTPTRRAVRTPTEREPEPKRPVVRDVLKEDAEKLAAFKAAQAARAEAARPAKKAEAKSEPHATDVKPEAHTAEAGKAAAPRGGSGKDGVAGEVKGDVAGEVDATADRKGRKTGTMGGRIVTRSNKQLEDVAARVNARLDAVNASNPAPSEKNIDVEALVAQINRRLEREAAARSARRQQARAKEAAAAPPRVALSWRVPVAWSEVQAATDAQTPRPTQLSWPVPSWVPAAEVAQGRPSGSGQGPIE